MKVSGIYRIVNKINGKSYVGLSRNISRRFVEHKTPRNLRKTSVLARAFRKHGIDNFYIEIIERCDLAALSDRERYWIDKLNPEYNMNDGGLGNLGHTVSPSVRRVLSDSARKQWEQKTPAEKKAFVHTNLKGPRVGHTVSEETRQKIRSKLKGVPLAKQTCIKIGQANKTSMVGNQNGNKPVEMVNKFGGVVMVFQSTRQAADFVGISPTNITGVISGRQKTAAGFCWRHQREKVQ